MHLTPCEVHYSIHALKYGILYHFEAFIESDIYILQKVRYLKKLVIHTHTQSIHIMYMSEIRIISLYAYLILFDHSKVYLHSS